MKNAILTVVLIFTVFISSAQLRVGDMAPDISLPDTKDSMVNLSSFRGKVVLLDFWASWCAPCRASNPGITKLYNKYKSKGFEVFGVSIDNKKAGWIKAIAQDKLKFTQVNDKAGWNSLIAEKYHVDQIPTSFVLDKTGKIVAIDIDGKELENKLKQLL